MSKQIMSKPESVLFLLGLLLASAGTRRAIPGELKRVKNMRALVIRPESRYKAEAHGIEHAFESYGLLVKTIDRRDLAREGRLYPKYAVTGLTSSGSYRFSDDEASMLKEYVRSGGAVYSSVGVPGKLESVFQISSTRQTPTTQIAIEPGSAVSAGLPGRLDYAWTHHPPGKYFATIVCDATGSAEVAARHPDGKALIVLAEHGAGRTCYSGSAIEESGHFVKAEKAVLLLENILKWLVRGKPVREDHSGVIEVALPRQAKVSDVQVDGRKIARFQAYRIGSLQKVQFTLPARREPQGRSARRTTRAREIEIDYAPLEKKRNVETVAHYGYWIMPWGLKMTPTELAEHLRALNVSTFIPGMYSQEEGTYVPNLPPPTDLWTVGLRQGTYRGNYWKDLLAECRKRGIKVWADYYFGMKAPRERYPETRVVKKDGSRNPKQCCFNNPKSLEHTIEVVNHLLDTYPDMEGITFDDNFNIDCHCPWCKKLFKDYCKRKTIEYRDTTTFGYMDEPWLDFRMECVHKVAEKLGKVVRGKGRKISHWIGASTTNLGLPCRAGGLSKSTDMLGLMVYGPSAAASARAFDKLVCRDDSWACVLLWGPNRSGELIEYEIEEAIRAGAYYVGVWLSAPADKRAASRMLEGAHSAMSRAFANAEETWLGYYRDNILTGDTRYGIVSGKIAETGLVLKLRKSRGNVDSRGGEKVAMEFLRSLRDTR